MGHCGGWLEGVALGAEDDLRTSASRELAAALVVGLLLHPLCSMPTNNMPATNTANQLSGADFSTSVPTAILLRVSFVRGRETCRSIAVVSVAVFPDRIELIYRIAHTSFIGRVRHQFFFFPTTDCTSLIMYKETVSARAVNNLAWLPELIFECRHTQDADWRRGTGRCPTDHERLPPFCPRIEMFERNGVSARTAARIA